MGFLLSIPSPELEKISKDLGISKQTITLKGQSLYDWLKATGKRRKDYRAFLRLCLRRDLADRPPGQFKSLDRYETLKSRLPDTR